MRLIVKKDYAECAQWVANYMAGKIAAASPDATRPYVLGLPTGSTPIGVYKRLSQLVQAGSLSLRDVITFNMDEYVGLPPTHEQSYHYFMHHNFFDFVDIQKKNIHILDGMAQDLDAECAAYERAIRESGGIDLFLGGTGNDGHIAFNEPGSSLASYTRVKTLTEDTRIANSRFFGGDSTQVPKTALTVGIGTIMDAKEVVIMMTGHSKAQALAHAVEQPVCQMWPVSILQMHKSAIIVCDEDCTEELKVGTVRYFRNIEDSTPDPYESAFRGR